jgi:hypothetical protein
MTDPHLPRSRKHLEGLTQENDYCRVPQSPKNLWARRFAGRPGVDAGKTQTGGDWHGKPAADFR